MIIAELSAAEIVALLNLQPHPEGGFYRETFRDSAQDANGRAASTLIYFLLPAGIVSAWHRVDAVETWHFYAGAPLKLQLWSGEGEIIDLMLGPDLLNGESPQGVVPRACWQRAESTGAWTLVGCGVAPGFVFSGFEIAPKGWTPLG
jgi:predicted cupin superfamily sugar epimerase